LASFSKELAMRECEVVTKVVERLKCEGVPNHRCAMVGNTVPI